MATSVYFNNYSAATINEQRLLEDLIGESIKIMGHDVHYLPREAWDGDDRIFGETQNAKFNRAYTMEMYLANVEGYEGDGDFFSKFGLEIRDTSNFVVSRRAFEKYVPSSIAARPREGDLIYIPVIQKIFEIKFVEEELMFFSLGKRDPYIYELRCEMFRYNNEDIDTGIEDIDIIEDRVSYAQMFNMISGSGAYHKNELIYQGSSFATASATAEVKDWNPETKKLEVINIKGVFASGVAVRGLTSNTIYTITTTDTQGDNSEYDLHDNRQLQDEANQFIDFSETNPFGLP
jgi:hypothetical protein